MLQRILTIVTLLHLFVASTSAYPGAMKTSPNLHKVKKIFIAKQENVPQDVDSGVRLDRVMRAELVKKGFVVVDDRGKADAILFGLVGEFLPIDGPAPSPPKYEYEYRLETATHAVLWSTKLSVSNRSKAVADQRGLERIVAGLFKEWKKSANGAGLKVGAKVS